MRTFRITLSHGNEHITFDGAGARSGSMFHVRRDAIEGLWSSPASKVSLTERETANGASPISDGETLYAARTVTIPFAIQSNYNHANLIRARILLGRLIGWHDVRVDVNDDGDETVLYGYVEAKYSDIPYDHADAGVITLVCPDPRRVSKNTSTISMNTSSSNLGGLSFGVPSYELAWTGTPNASASTLSQNGTVVATNAAEDPNITQTIAAFAREGTWVRSPDATSPTGFSWTFTAEKDDWQWLGSLWLIGVKGLVSNPHPGEKMHVLIYSGSTLSHSIGLGIMCHNESSWWRGTQDGVTIQPGPMSWGETEFTMPTDHNIQVKLASLSGVGSTGTVTIGAVMLLTDTDYQALQALGVDWFSGDTQSPKANLGLAFPLDFGQEGNAGNTGMIANNGSYTAMPTITAHGSLDSGLTVHWNTSDGNEGDLSFNGNVGNAPVTINTDSRSAIMGGLDVSYQLGSRDWPRIPAGGSCSFALLASGGGWVTVQSNDTYM